MERDWERALGKFSYGIYVLTTSHQGEINGMIASWVSQVSYDPPLVMVAVHPNRYSHGMVDKSGKFALNVVAKEQGHWLGRFKGPDPAAKFQGLKWKKGATGCPILEESLAYVECQVVDSYRPGNHTLFVGRIIAAQLLEDNIPLTTLDYEGTYLGKR